MADTTLGDESLVAFFQALALVIVNFDDVPPEERVSGNFIRSLDGYLGALVSHAEKEGSDIGETVQVVRRLFDRSLTAARTAKEKGGPVGH